MSKLVCPNCQSDRGFEKVERTVSVIFETQNLWDPEVGDAPSTQLIGIECLECGEWFLNEHSDYNQTIDDVIEYSEEVKK
jgi:hypothetical protein